MPGIDHLLRLRFLRTTKPHQHTNGNAHRVTHEHSQTYINFHASSKSDRDLGSECITHQRECMGQGRPVDAI